MLKIRHAAHARSLRVVWAAEEMGIRYEVRHLPYDPAALQGEEYLRINPFGREPEIEDGGVRMNESGAICHYLAEKYGRPPFARALGDPDYPAYLQWLHAGEASLTPPLTMIAQHTRFRPPEQRISLAAEDAAARFHEHLAILDHELGGKEYLLGGDLSLPDVVVGYALHLADLFGLMNAAPPHVSAYWRRLRARPAYEIAAAA